MKPDIDNIMVVDLLDKGVPKVVSPLYKMFFRGTYAKMQEETLKAEFGQYDALRGRVKEILVRLINFRRVYVNVVTGEVSTP